MANNTRAGEKILSVQDMHVSYGKIAAIKGISFDVHRGEIVSVLGANGAGKTTTLNALSGAIPIQSGTITKGGRTLNGLPPHEITRLGVVHVPEGRHIFPKLTVYENLRVASYLYEGKKKELFKERLEYVYRLFPRLKERINQDGGTLSGGEQQMLAIGRAIITGSDVLLLDEPSMGLSPKLVQEIFETIVRISEAGQTIMLVEQNAAMTMEISSYCYVLETGTIAFEGTPDVVSSNNDIVSAYLG